MEALEAVGQAIQEEKALMQELIDNKTERAKKVRKQMCVNVYAGIHLLNN